MRRPKQPRRLTGSRPTDRAWAPNGTDGSDKMSSSKDNYVAIDDEPEVIKKKLQKSFCPQGQVEGNPIIEIAEHFIFTENKTLLIERPEKFGGNLELNYEIY